MLHTHTSVLAAHSATYSFPSSVPTGSQLKIQADCPGLKANMIPMVADKLLIDNLKPVCLLAHLINTQKFLNQPTFQIPITILVKVLLELNKIGIHHCLFFPSENVH